MTRGHDHNLWEVIRKTVFQYYVNIDIYRRPKLWPRNSRSRRCATFTTFDWLNQQVCRQQLVYSDTQTFLTLSAVEKTPYGRFWIGKWLSGLTWMKDIMAYDRTRKLSTQASLSTTHVSTAQRDRADCQMIFPYFLPSFSSFVAHFLKKSKNLQTTNKA